MVEQVTSDHPVRFSRHWAMPNLNTFSVKPIGAFVQKYLAHSTSSIDPFARDNEWATWRNDINPATKAPSHMDAVTFLEQAWNGSRTRVDLAILDPPYSPRQISESYKAAGLQPSQVDTQNARLMAAVRKALMPMLSPGAIVLSFGWNSSGMGKGFELLEVCLVNHGGAHNDTICVAERFPL